jgi:hypothetical protein
MSKKRKGAYGVRRPHARPFQKLQYVNSSEELTLSPKCYDALLDASKSVMEFMVCIAKTAWKVFEMFGNQQVKRTWV